MLRMMGHLLAKMLMQRDLTRVTPRQRAALTEALMLTVVAPHRTPDDERLTLRLELLALTRASRAHGAVSGFGGRDMRLLRSDDVDFLLPFGKSLAHELEDKTLQELVYRILVALVLADGGCDRDVSALAPVGIGLEVSPNRAAEIIDEVKDDVVALVM
jgi:hypothetical protein